MGNDQSPAVFQVPLMEVDDDLRGLLLVDRKRTVRAIAVHLLLRTRPHLLFRRDQNEVTLEDLVDRTVDAILTVPERVLGDFAQEDAAPRAAATDFIARTVFEALTGSFETAHADRPGGV
ncbi:hypothetical protein NGR_b10220 (plasmid) [Sinorhizobium fredii NGR234]|uniref:Uncharacterized protein n=1 Tax=Sinorhizobium fredii (strain NBRC 101917 / NGR234) TaxID=394 RepID=C3KQW7_SINFN|nr:hypothetical protein [Sinorhizobium fredii]ACP22475.1 hypothetical protein NGR_b10220 [Sinorhizobium fredii NGR234]